ncbi:EmrB/QacA family drug resistance transporter [Pseudomonas chlororaphis]|jgi:DHA2 family multidrug resistance protein|uniref:DHA2 family efflux MFS transporter permease subunit n=1 Tax=Pseudomonas morbosilactucae TaxID=2938197 RepID=A0ABT0JH88_9PSED|nr:DHA2 family efflux MFS transporter permease subunit [Pseudomonas morbosilactucae]MCK9815250.1 DHA2 family efflux MFS transporter permease subunit [Pseudomonas morbosilactucae]ROL65797.1 EmrB/QacA family drug resistance transporter [Pseudomonas chlororaphis]
MSSAEAVPAISLRTWVAVLGSVVGCFMAGMNVHVTNASLPDVRGSLGATFEEGSWITTAYLVAEIIIIPMTGWLVSVFSMRRVLMVGSAGFVLFSIACSLAPTIESLILARVLQGAFGGVLIPLSFQLIVSELPAARHPLGMALFAVANNVAQAAGPSLGGWLTDAYSWRWIFYLQVPPGLLLLAAIGWSVRPQPMALEKLRQGDWGGIATMAVGLAALQILLEEGGRHDWFASSFIVNCALLAVVGLLAFVYIELRREQPLINLRLLGRYNFGIASLMQFSFGAVVFGVVFLVPNYFAEIHGFNARQIGLMMIPYGLVQFAMSFATPRLMRWTSARTIIIAGFAFTAIGCLMNMHLNPDASLNVIVPSLVVRGIGQSLVVVALGVMAIQGLEKEQLGSASGLFSMVRNVGGAIGIALSSQIVVEREKLHAHYIGESLNLFTQATQERWAALINVLGQRHLDTASALHSSAAGPLRQQALALMDKVVHRDALLLAYSDGFLLAGLAMLLCVLAGFLLRRA